MSLVRSAYIGLGSNQGDAVEKLKEAIALLDDQAGLEFVRQSSYYLTRPWGGVEQADFVNAVAEFRCNLEAEALLELLLSCEQALGRVRTGPRWGPRIIDLDLLLFGDKIYHRPELIIPHPRMHRRAFVLIPLAELDPRLRIPGIGRVDSCLQRLVDKGDDADVKMLSSVRQ